MWLWQPFAHISEDFTVLHRYVLCACSQFASPVELVIFLLCRVCLLRPSQRTLLTRQSLTHAITPIVCSKLSAGLSVFGSYQQHRAVYGKLEQSTGPIFMPNRANLPPVPRERSTSAPNVSYNIVQVTDVPTFQVTVVRVVSVGMPDCADATPHT